MYNMGQLVGGELGQLGRGGLGVARAVRGETKNERTGLPSRKWQIWKFSDQCVVLVSRVSVLLLNKLNSVIDQSINKSNIDIQYNNTVSTLYNINK